MDRQLWQNNQRDQERPSTSTQTPGRSPVVHGELVRNYPQTFVEALREADYYRDSMRTGSSLDHDHEFATTGVGLGAYGRMELFPLSSFDMYDADYCPSAGQAALKEVRRAQVMRTKERTMEELTSIMGRIQFTLADLRTVEIEKAISLTPEVQERRELEEERKRKERMKRRILKKKQKENAKSKKKVKGLAATLGDKKEGLVETGAKIDDKKDEVVKIEKEKEKQGEKTETAIEQQDGKPISDADSDVQSTKNEISDNEKDEIVKVEKEKEIRSETTGIAVGQEDSKPAGNTVTDGQTEGQDDDDIISWSSGELEHYYSSDFSDISSDDEETSDEMVELQKASSLTRMAEKRRRTSESIACYFDRCLERDELMRQMHAWMETATTEELEDFPESFKSSEHAMQISPDLLDDSRTIDIELTIHAFRETMGKLKYIADSLGIGAEEEEQVEEIEESTTDKKRLSIQKPKMGTKVYTEDELARPDNFEAAISNLAKVLDDAIKSTPARLLRLSLTSGLKQFKFICKIIEKRESTISVLDKEMLKLGGDLAKNKKLVEDLRKYKKKIQMKCEKLDHIVDDQKTKMAAKMKRIEELTKTVEDYKKKESYGLYDQSSLSSSTSSASLSASSEEEEEKEEEEEEEAKVETKEKPTKKAGKKGKKGVKGGKGKLKKSKSKEEKSEKKKQDSSQKTTADQKAGQQDDNEVEEHEEEKDTKTKVAKVDIENSEVYLDLKFQYETTCNEIEIEREKLAEVEKEFENAKSEKVLVEQEKSDLIIEIDNVRRQNEVETEELHCHIANFEMETKKLQGEIECNEEMIQYQEERIGQYAEDLQNLEERLMGSLPNTPAMSSTSFAKSARRSITRTRTSVTTEPPTARQMVAKIRQQYESEIQGLKDYLAKENQRFSAESRRKDHEHKKDIQNIHKESLQVLRSINRFKDCAANLLDRENLPTEAHMLRKLPLLPLDDLPGEVRQMLARMAILSNELLVSIELQLSKALMSKRLEVKGTAASRTIAKNTLDVQTTHLRKSKDFANLQVTKLKNVKDELVEQEAEFTKFKLQEGEKQEVLEERYDELVYAFITLRRESLAAKKVEKTDREKEEELERKELIIKKFMRKEKVLNRALEEQRKVIVNLTTAWRSRRFGQLYISKADQLDNLDKLKEALLKDRIAKGLYEMTTNLIQEAIDLPRKRLIDLVQKYVRYVNMKEMELRARRMKIEEDLGDGAMKFIHMLEKRIEMQQELWNKKKEAFIKHRAETLMNLSKVLTHINEETNILVTLPKIIMRRAGQEEGDLEHSRELPDLHEAVKLIHERQKMKQLEDMKGTTGQLTGPSPPLGVRVDQMAMEKSWQMKGMPHQSSVSVTTPRILDLDVNMTRLAAHQFVSQVSRRPWDQLSKSQPDLKTFTSRFALVEKSFSQPASKRLRATIQAKRSLTLPPIATLYSSAEFTNQQK